MDSWRDGRSYNRPAGDFRAGRASLLHTLAVNAPFVQMNGRSSDIALACIYLTVPLTTLTVILLSLIYTHRIVHEEGPFSNLPVANLNNDRHSVYVTLSSTFIVFIASWMSSLAPVLAGFAVGLAAYSVGQKLLRDTRRAKLENLPTPYQLSLTLRFLNGSTWTALWFWVLYKLGWRQKPLAQAKSLTSVIAIAVATTILGLAVFGADTWMHIATTTVDFVKVTDVTYLGQNYSLGLLAPNCTSTNNSIAALAVAGTTCGLDLGSGLFINGTEPIRTLNDFSNTVTIQDSDDSGLKYLSPSIAVLDPSHDFSAVSYGAVTECKPISQECVVQKSGNVTFTCNNGSFAGALAVPDSGLLFKLASFVDQDMSMQAANPEGLQNPFYTAVAALMVSPGNGEFALASDPGIVPLNGGLAFMLFCNTTILDISYNVVNGTTIKVLASASNITVTNALIQPFVNSAFGLSNLNTALDIGVQFANTAQDLANAFASSFAKVVLSAGVQAISPRPATEVQQRNKILVAKIPYGPIIALVAANFCFVILGLSLTFVALRTPSEAREVQTRLCIAGLVADRFEGARARVGVPSLERMFDEYRGNSDLRVGIDRSRDGGYVFRTLGMGSEPEKNFDEHDEWHNVKLGSERAGGWI